MRYVSLWFTGIVYLALAASAGAAVISFDEYPNEEIPLERVINIMVGDLQRIKMYPEKGFQIYQQIPSEVWNAYETLLRLGFDKHLMKE